VRPLTGERRAARDGHCAAAVLLVTVGIFEFGRAFQTWQVNAARGARVAPRIRSPVGGARVGYDLGSTTIGNRRGERNAMRRSASVANASASIVTVQYPTFHGAQPRRTAWWALDLGAAPITMTSTAEMRTSAIA
jgi:hypothetical protein